MLLFKNIGIPHSVLPFLERGGFLGKKRKNMFQNHTSKIDIRGFIEAL